MIAHVPVCHDLFDGFYALRLLMNESLHKALGRWKSGSSELKTRAHTL